MAGASRRDLAEASAAALAAALPDRHIRVSARFDPKTERH
jgi:hypothetical protein